MKEDITTLESMTTQEFASYEYELLYEKSYGKVYLLPQQYILICELTASYVPIEKFRKIFTKMGDFVKEHNIKKFVFDKRQLRTFHQPSMEWYFITWKKEMLAEGLTVHRKILPKGEPWFENAVRAGRDKIKRDFPDNVIDQLDIAYRDSLLEAIES
jgi:hypothetical protein